MTRKSLIISIINALVMLIPVGAAANDADSVQQRIFMFGDPLLTATDQSFKNPALRYFEHTVSLSDVALKYESHRESRPVDVQQGDGYDHYAAGAESYIRHGQASLWGHAYYQQGRRHNVLMNESADAALIYPYLTADPIGGDIESECYSLSGGYAHRSGSWAYGVQLDYDAGLYYRNVDPRPKNITGLLCLSAGLSYQVVGKYSAGISADASVYRQSSDIMFVSETGKAQILHLTGLGNHYRRFAGTAETSHYCGSEYGVTLNLFPADRRGLTATMHLSYFRFNKTLTDLNKLPLCRAWHKSITTQIAYLGSNWAVGGKFDAYRRHGIENLFGDAQSGVYPQIGSLEMYSDNYYSLSANGVYTISFDTKKAVDISADAGYSHRRQLYAEPHTEAADDYCHVDLNCRYRAIIASDWNLRVVCKVCKVYKVHQVYEDDGGSYSGIIDCQLTHNLSDKYAIGLGASYRQSRYRHSINAHTLDTSIQFIF